MSKHGHDQHVSHQPAAGHLPSGRPSYFTQKEWDDFQKSDIHGGGVVVALMAGIFLIGLALYTTIALVV